MSYVVAELFGHGLGTAAAARSDCRRAVCSFMGAVCDGGGNRDMMRVAASDEAIGPLFDREVGESTGGFLPCGICSVRKASGEIWAICPRRLFALSASGVSERHASLAARILRLGGFSAGEEVDVWSEVFLRDRGPSGEKFNYRLDYVLRSRTSRSAPVIIEVMTCSTSGGNKAKGTDIQSAFRRAVLRANGIRSEPVASPGVNIRQVWARMASQMIAKSEVAVAWGGRTIWIVQDALASYIQDQTALPLDALHSPQWEPGEVNLVVSDLDGPKALYSGPIRPEGSDRRCWLEILGAPYVPPVTSLTDKLDGLEPLVTLAVE